MSARTDAVNGHGVHGEGAAMSRPVRQAAHPTRDQAMRATTNGTTARELVAIGYARRSKESGERTVSLEDQAARIRAYVTEHGWALAAIVTDDGVSGGKRSRLHRLEAAVREYGAGTVVTYHLDRFARDVAAMLETLRAFTRRGVELHACNVGRVEASTSNGYLVTAVNGVIAEHYRLLVGEKTRAALGRLRESGRRYSNVPPYGWRIADDRRRLEPADDEQRTLHLICALSTGRSLRALSAELAARGVYARNGRPFAPMTLARLRAVTDRAVGDSACACEATAT